MMTMMMMKVVCDGFKSGESQQHHQTTSWQIGKNRLSTLLRW